MVMMFVGRVVFGDCGDSVPNHAYESHGAGVFVSAGILIAVKLLTRHLKGNLVQEEEFISISLGQIGLHGITFTRPLTQIE